MNKHFILLLTVFLFHSPAFSFNISNMETPESFIVDPEDGYYYVSNIEGLPADKDGHGSISKIDPSGKTIIQKFIGSKKEEGLLNAPKGLTILGKDIFVTDIDTVKGYDKATGKPTVLVDLSKSGAKFLNDIAIDDRGCLYVSDTLANRIYKIDSKNNYVSSIYIEDKELGKPNGLFWNPKSKNLMVASLESGKLLEIDRAGRIHVLKKGLSTLDGLDIASDGRLYISSHEKGEIYEIARFGRGRLVTILSGLVTPADISLDKKKNELLIPSFSGNTVTTVPLQAVKNEKNFKKS